MSEGLPRVLVLGDDLADHVAAGEVVERPASVVKELVDNSVDAGSSRVDVELEAGGVERIVVVDDGHGIHPADLELAVTRHATSKLRRVADLADVSTLGFRGEALASIAAVSSVSIASRRRGETAGERLSVGPGKPPRREPLGMPVGTRIEVEGLFGAVPARRKFLRSEATELGHASEAVLRVALVHPDVRFGLRHGRRMLLELPRASAAERITQVLARRAPHAAGHRPVFVQGEREGIAVQAWLMPAAAAVRRAAAISVVVRRRVVREPNLSRIVTAWYGDSLAAGTHAVACLWVEPAPGEVDVNVHPQKAEVRFADPQRVYAAVREVLAGARPPGVAPPAATTNPDVSPRRSLADALDEGIASAVAREPASRGGGTGLSSSAAPYRLRTRATEAGYASERQVLRTEAEQLKVALGRAAALDGASGGAERAGQPLGGPGASLGVGAGEDVAPAPDGAPAEDGSRTRPLLLTCLPGPVGIFRQGDDLLAVDLRALRSHLVYRRLREDLGTQGIEAQALVTPAVLDLPADDLTLVSEHGDALSQLGLVIEPFGDGAAIVRAVPVGLSRCVEQPDVADLVRRALPWLRVHARGAGAAADAGARTEAAMRALAGTGGTDPAPRLARRWLAELIERGDDLDAIPGIRRHRASDLVVG